MTKLCGGANKDNNDHNTIYKPNNKQSIAHPLSPIFLPPSFTYSHILHTFMQLLNTNTQTSMEMLDVFGDRSSATTGDLGEGAALSSDPRIGLGLGLGGIGGMSSPSLNLTVAELGDWVETFLTVNDIVYPSSPIGAHTHAHGLGSPGAAERAELFSGAVNSSPVKTVLGSETSFVTILNSEHIDAAGRSRVSQSQVNQNQNQHQQKEHLQGQGEGEMVDTGGGDGDVMPKAAGSAAQGRARNMLSLQPPHPTQEPLELEETQTGMFRGGSYILYIL